MKNLFHNFYVQPMSQVFIEIIAIYMIWSAAMFLLRGKARRVVGIICVSVAVILILMFTVLGRSSGGARGISLIPFITFENAKMQPELYRTMFMNVLLFMPFGLSFPFALCVSRSENRSCTGFEPHSRRSWNRTSAAHLTAHGLPDIISTAHIV